MASHSLFAVEGLNGLTAWPDIEHLSVPKVRERLQTSARPETLWLLYSDIDAFVAQALNRQPNSDIYQLTASWQRQAQQLCELAQQYAGQLRLVNSEQAAACYEQLIAELGNQAANQPLPERPESLQTATVRLWHLLGQQIKQQSLNRVISEALAEQSVKFEDAKARTQTQLQADIHQMQRFINGLTQQGLCSGGSEPLAMTTELQRVQEQLEHWYIQAQQAELQSQQRQQQLDQAHHTIEQKNAKLHGFSQRIKALELSNQVIQEHMQVKVSLLQAQLAQQGRLRHLVKRSSGRDHLEDENLALIRKSSLFCADSYLQAHPDVAESGMDPAWHYLHHGGFENRNPSPAFHSAWYLQQNSDVAAEGVNPLLHYIKFGAAEGRQPKP